MESDKVQQKADKNGTQVANKKPLKALQRSEWDDSYYNMEYTDGGRTIKEEIDVENDDLSKQAVLPLNLLFYIRLSDD